MFAEPKWLGHFAGHLGNSVAAGLLLLSFRAWDGRIRNRAEQVTQIALIVLTFDLALEAQAAWIEYPAAGPLHTVTTALTLPLVVLAVVSLMVTLVGHQRWVRRVPTWFWGLSGVLAGVAVLALMVMFTTGAG